MPSQSDMVVDVQWLVDVAGAMEKMEELVIGIVIVVGGHKVLLGREGSKYMAVIEYDNEDLGMGKVEVRAPSLSKVLSKVLMEADKLGLYVVQ
jgi:uridylate kinase